MTLTIFEFGAGDVIRTIRQSAERYTADTIPFFRINPSDYKVKRSNHYAISLGAKEALERLYCNFQDDKGSSNV